MVSTKVIVVVVLLILVVILVVWRSSSKREATSSLLPPPQGVRAESNNGTIKILWEGVKEADSYTMYYSNHPNFTKQEARLIEGIRLDGSDEGLMQFSISKVPPGSYYYRVASVKGDKESVWTDEMNVAVQTCQPPAPPTELRQEESDSNSVLLKWNRVPTADGYVLYVTSEKSPKDFSIAIEDPLRTEHSLSDLDPQFEWKVTIASRGAHCGEGEPSSPLQLKVD